MAYDPFLTAFLRPRKNKSGKFWINTKLELDIKQKELTERIENFFRHGFASLFPVY